MIDKSEFHKSERLALENEIGEITFVEKQRGEQHQDACICECRARILLSNPKGMHRITVKQEEPQGNRATPIKQQLTTGCAIFLFLLSTTLRSNTRPHPQCTRTRMKIPRKR